MTTGELTRNMTEAQVKALHTISEQGGNAGLTMGSTKTRPGFVTKTVALKLIALGLVQCGNDGKGMIYVGTYRPSDGDRGGRINEAEAISRNGIFLTARGACAIHWLNARDMAAGRL